jgi:hypothetical protein
MKTAVGWLLFELSKNGLLPDGIPSDIHNQAKEMERERMIEFACQVAEASAMKYIQGKTTMQIAQELTKQPEQ